MMAWLSKFFEKPVQQFEKRPDELVQIELSKMRIAKRQNTSAADTLRNDLHKLLDRLQ